MRLWTRRILVIGITWLCRIMTSLKGWRRQKIVCKAHYCHWYVLIVENVVRHSRVQSKVFLMWEGTTSSNLSSYNVHYPNMLSKNGTNENVTVQLPSELMDKFDSEIARALESHWRIWLSWTTNNLPWITAMNALTITSRWCECVRLSWSNVWNIYF